MSVPPPMSLLDAKTAHQRLLADWRSSFPGSSHAYYGLDELEALKAENDRLAEIDMRERPVVCASYPTLVTIGNTHRCNLTCNMCFKQLDDVENMSLPDLGLGRFESLGHELFPHLRKVALSVSGEALISRTIFQELELLRTYAVRACVTTNGMPLSKRGLYEHLIPALDTLTLSCDGASAPVFNAIRRGADFDRVLQNLRAFNQHRDALPRSEFRPQLHFNVILQWRNVTELPRIIELAHAFDVDAVFVDHVLILEDLNREDSLERHKLLTNRMLAEAERTARRLGVQVELPAPFAIGEDYEELEYRALNAELLLTQAHERPDTVPFDPALHERFEEEEIHRAIQRAAQQGRGNPAFVGALQNSGRLPGHLQWGIPQLGPSLVPKSCEKGSDCSYLWEESFVEFNGVVAPCCNPALNASRVMGVYSEEGGSFRDIWNGSTYQELRRSLAAGKPYKFCRYCYLFESVDEAARTTGERWFRRTVSLENGQPVPAGQVPPGQSLVITSLRADGAAEGLTLELGLTTGAVAAVPARHTKDGWECEADFTPKGGLPFAPGQVLYLRCSGAEGMQVEVEGYSEPAPHQG